MAADSSLNFGLVLRNVANLAGWDWEVLTTVEWRLIRDLASRRIKAGWQAAKWPQVCVIEERTVTQSGGDEGNYIEFSQAGETGISEVFAVWDRSPKSNKNALDLTWALTENGIQIEESNTTAFVWFRKPAPEFTGELYSQSSAYSTGDQVYDNTAKDFYVALEDIASGSDQSPTAQPSKWSLVSVPAFLRDYLIRGTFADLLRHNGELDRSRVAESDAREALDHELIQHHIQQGQTTRLTVVGY